MNDWPLNDLQLVTAAILGDNARRADCDRVSKSQRYRKEFALLREDVKRLSEEVKELQAAEERRFIKELNVSQKTTKSRPRRLNPSPVRCPPSEQTVN